ncbi:histidinol-phosphate transaminase [Methanofollis formosanus]|uniref:Histidinol-phosphate aminotransferase n=1 Tax=Methanofollis formosanus TaxID=299308 RepID=A0A8G1EFW1_9EURY|nr:histidinol-phosphate transaminase [Methanofollis formosanus]QYZ78539.1 histidinol-phosphate transaminase [Methanofollis formosanus]
MRRSVVRRCYATAGGYVFAKSAEEIAREQGLSRVARLASNENPASPSEAVIAAGLSALKEGNRYPAARAAAVTVALRRLHGDHAFLIGNGMDGVIETVVRTVVEPGDRVVISTPTFSFYNLTAAAQGAEVVEVPREPDFSVDPDRFVEACQGAKLAFLCTPNNPTGNVVPVDVVREILDRTDCLLFLDNAYIEFSDVDYRPLMREYDHLIEGRTMSKAYSLAGLRFGYAFVPEWLAPHLEQAATPFAVNSVALAAAEAALADRAHIHEVVAHVRRWRDRFMAEIPLPVAPSEANFILIDVAPMKGDEAMERLAAGGVVVRSCRSFPGLEDRYIRVSIGADWENELFLEKVRDLR